MADPHADPLDWVSPTLRTVRRDAIDLLECYSVELMVDQTNKVWLNVNGMCVFRAGLVDVVTVEDSGDVTVLRRDPKERI